MADELLTSQDTPSSDGTTVSPEPESSSAELEPQPQPSQRELELQTQLDRLQANNKGTFEEWKRTKDQLDKVQGLLAQYQTSPQPSHTAPQSGPSDEELIKTESDALISGDHQRALQARQVREDRNRAKMTQEFAGIVAQASTLAQQQQALGTFITSKGLKQQQVIARVDEMKTDPTYAFTGYNPAWLASIAAQELETKTKSARIGATEGARQASADAAATEAPKGNGALPGKSKPAEKIYLRSEEQKAVSLLRSAKRCSQAEAERAYWSNLPEAKRLERQKAGHA